MSDSHEQNAGQQALTWFRSKPHLQPLLWLMVCMIAQLMALNFYLGAWRYGEHGFSGALFSFSAPVIVILLLIMGARGYLKHTDPADALICFLAITTLKFVFGPIKSTIPQIIPYYLDEHLIALDRFLHFGQLPHEYLTALQSSQLVGLIAIAYYLFALVCAVAYFTAAFLAPRSHAREAFVIAFIATWYINGSILAMLLSSAGPIFLDVFYDGQLVGPYREAIAIICQGSSLTCEAKDWLLDMHFYAPVLDLNGPSAMPSLHIASVFLVALYVQHSFRKYAVYGWLFFGSIFIGSITLLWHYAVDAYLSIITTWIIWRLSLYWVARFDRKAQLSRNESTA